MHAILDELERTADSLSPQLRRAARCIIERPNRVAVVSMRSLAAEACVAPPTMVRLARRMGFVNYESFRAVFREAIAQGSFQSRASRLQELQGRGGEGEVIAQIGLSATSNIETFLGDLDLPELVRISDLLRQAPTAYVVASGGLHWGGVYLQNVGRMAVPRLRVPLLSDSNLIEGLGAVEPGDTVLAISVSPYAKASLEAVRFAKERGATVIAITDSRTSPFAKVADHRLFVTTGSPQYFPSMVAVTLVVECLMATIVSRSDRRTVDRIAEFEALRKRSGAYL